MNGHPPGSIGEANDELRAALDVALHLVERSRKARPNYPNQQEDIDRLGVIELRIREALLHAKRL